MDLTQLVLALLGSNTLTGLFTAWYTGKSNAKKTDLDNLRSSFDELRAENTRLSKRVEMLEAENVEKDKVISSLRVDLATWQGKYCELEYNYKILIRDTKEIQQMAGIKGEAAA